MGHCLLWGAQGMWLAHKYNTDPGSVGGLQFPQPLWQPEQCCLRRGFLFWPSHIQYARLWNLSLQILGQKWMVSQQSKTCRGLRRPARGYISWTWTSWQSVISEFCYHGSNPQPIKPQVGGLTSRNLSFPLALLTYNNQMCLIKWLVDFMSKVEGMAMGDPVLVTEHLTIQFLSLREAMKLYILFKVKQVSVKEATFTYAGMFIFCSCSSLCHCFSFSSNWLKEPPHWLDAQQCGLLW